MGLIPVLFQASQPVISDTAVKILVDAGLSFCLIALGFVATWFMGRPLVNGLLSRNQNVDGATKAFMDESRAAHDDNRRLIDVIEKGREEDRRMTEAIQGLTIAVQQSNATTAKLIDVAMGNIQIQQMETQKLPALLEGQRKVSVEEVINAMTQGFELRDEKFETILERLDELDHKFDANERVTEDMKTLLTEVRDLLKSARPVEHKDTDPLPSLPDASAIESPAPEPPDADKPSEDKPKGGLSS